MSKHVVHCQRCERHWNIKHQGNSRPKCGWFRFANDTPITPEDVSKLQEHFNGG